MQKNYLVIAEVESIGFITEYFQIYKEAEEFSKELFSLSDMFCFHETYKVAAILKNKNYLTYQINGNEVYLGKGASCISNGAYTVSVYKIDRKQFCLKSFIRERENHSSVLSDEKYRNQLDNLCELFPKIDLIAN